MILIVNIREYLKFESTPIPRFILENVKKNYNPNLNILSLTFIRFFDLMQSTLGCS
jgi:hypothetical protein